MMLKLLIIDELVVPAAILIGAFLVGIFLRNVVLVYLQKLAKRTKWRFGDIVIGSLKSSIIPWSLALGLYVLIESQGMLPKIENVSSKALGVLVIFSFTVVISHIGTEIVEYYDSTIKGFASATSLLKNIVRVAVYSVGLLIIMDDLHISIAPLLTALGVGGLAIGLGLQETLSNFFAGMQILAARQMQVGNYVKLSTGDEGFIQDLNWRATVIRTLSGNHVIVPNKNLANLIVTNFDKPNPDVSIMFSLGVDYSADLKKVETITVEVARKIQRTVEGAQRNFVPFIRYSEFSDSAIKFSVILRSNTYNDQYLMKHEFIKQLKERYDKEGIVIPFPVRTVYLDSAVSRDYFEATDVTMARSSRGAGKKRMK